MELFRFTSELMSSLVEALEKSSQGHEEPAKAQLQEIARKIQNEMPATNEQPAPWPGQGQT